MSDSVLVIKKIVEKISPAILEMLETKDAGHIEIHFSNGSFTRARKEITI